MEAVVERGTGEARADRRLHRRRQDRHGEEARRTAATRRHRLQRVVRRLRAVAQPAVHDRRRHRLAAARCRAYGGVVAAPIFQRIADAALRHDGVPPSINAPPPLLVGAPRRPRARAGRRPVRAGSAGRRDAGRTPSRGSTSLFPDLRGHERARRAARAGAARPDAAAARRRRRGRAATRPPGAPIDRGASAHALARRGTCREPGRADAAMTVGELLQALARALPPDERPAMCPPTPARSTCACTGVTHDSRRAAPGIGLRGAARAARPTAPRSRRRRSPPAPRRSWPSSRAARRRGVPWIVVRRRAPRAGAARRRVLRPPEPRDARRRHHRHQRQDDDELPGQPRSSRPPASGAA